MTPQFVLRLKTRLGGNDRTFGANPCIAKSTSRVNSRGWLGGMPLRIPLSTNRAASRAAYLTTFGMKSRLPVKRAPLA
jgi:hypothetical protein